MFAAGEEETIFLADTRDDDNKIVTRLRPSFFFFPLSFPTLSSSPPSHPSPRFLSPRPRHPSVVSSLLPLLDTVDPWWHRRGRATVTRYFAGEIPPENPLWEKFFSLGPNSGRLHCRIIATPLNRNPSAEEEVIVPRAPPTNQPVATFFSSPPPSTIPPKSWRIVLL